MSEPITINFDHAISVFPLPGCVLLPFGLLPLHIFEPRYRQMTRDALDFNGLIAMGLFDGNVTDEDYHHGRPSIRPHVCAAYLQKYEKTKDGRYYVLLQGVIRARIVEEIEHDPYRKVMLEPTEHPPRTDDQLEDARQRIVDALARSAMDDCKPVQQARALLDQPFPTAGLIDLMIQVLSEEPEVRYAMLVEPDAMSRADWLVSHIDSLDLPEG